MTDYKQLCAELVDELEGWVAYGDEIDIINAHVLIDRARAALAQPEPEGPTDEELLEALKAGVASFPPRHPEALNLSAVEYEVELEIRKARAVLARWGNCSAPQPIPVSKRWPEPEEMAEEEEVWVECVGYDYPIADTGDYHWEPHMWILRPITQSDIGHNPRWLPAHALPVPSHD